MSRDRSRFGRFGRGVAGAVLVAATAAACSSTPGPPVVRPIILPTGARLSPDPQRMQAVGEWVLEIDEDIELNPAFLVRADPVEEEVYPWHSVIFQADTVTYQVNENTREAQEVYAIYARLKMLDRDGELAEEWVPEAEGTTGFETELIIVRRIADAWLFGRTVYDFGPYAPLDEITWAREEGYLEAFLLSARSEEFPEARERLLADNPDAIDEYAGWFRRTFGRAPPGIGE